MSERNTNSRKRLIVILIAAIAVLAIVLGVCIFFALGGQSQPDPTEPSGTTGNVFVPDPTDPTDDQQELVLHCICGSKTDSHLEGCDGAEHPWTAWTETDSLPTVSGKYYLTADVNLVPVADITTSESIYLDLNGFNINSPTRVYRMAVNDTEVSLTVLDSVGTSVVTLTEHANAASFVLLGGTGNKTLTIYGGTIDGSALKADPTDKNGGVIRAATTPCTVNIHGGTIIGAATAKFGGTLYVEHGALNITGGEIKNGHALQGGNLFAKDATVTISGGKISGGTAEGADNSRGGNIFNNNSKITVSGTAEIFDGKATYLGDNVFSVAGSSIENTGKIYMTGSTESGIYPVPDEPEDTNHMACICGSKTDKHLAGCDGTKYAWRPWKSATTLPSTAGRYYLTADVNLDATVTVANSAEIFIDLNGKTVTSQTRVYLLNAAKADISLTVLDTVGTGKVVMSKYAEGATFAAIGNTGNKVLTVNGGTFDASAISSETPNGGIIRVGSETSTLNVNGGTLIGAAMMKNGGAVHINGGTMNMTGGEIKDGHANNGGNIFLNGGSLTVTGGTISGGTAEGAENSRGGNIFNNVGKVSISGTAEVINGVAVLGNNIFNAKDSTFENTGKVVLENGDPGIYPVVIEPEDTEHMACICGSKTDKHLSGCDGTKLAWRPWSSTVTLPTESGRYYLTSDVTLSEIQVISADANVYLDLNGKTVNRGTADRIFNLTLTDKMSSLTVLDSVGTGKLELGNAEAAGTLVILNSGEKTFTMYGGTVNGAGVVTKGSGAVIRNVNQTVNIHGGTVIGGTAKGDGSNSGNGGAIYNGGTMTVTGGEISGGSAVNGGNIYNAGALTVSGTAQILDGTASNLGHNICNADGSKYTNGGKVYLTGYESAFGIYPAREGCICGSKTDAHLSGCDGTKVKWSEWTDKETLPCKSGYYFLTEDVTLKEIQVIGIDANVYIDLNGKTVNRGTADRVFNQILTDKANSLTILDSVGTGKIELGTEKAAGALVILNTGNKTFTMYGGTVNGAGIEGSTSGGVIIRNIGQNVNIHGGTVIGAQTKGDGVNSGVGGTIWNSGKLTVTGGKITGGKAVNGGNIYNSGKLAISGTAEVIDGTATKLGHNIFNASGSSFTCSGKVYLTSSENAVGVYPAYQACICGSKTEDHLTGCDGTLVNWSEWTESDSLPTTSGYYFLTEDVTLTENQVIGIEADVYLDLNGKTVNRGTANRVFILTVTDKRNSLTILDSVGTGKIELGNTEAHAGALAILNSGEKTLTMYGGTVNGKDAIFKADVNGAIIRNVNQTVNIYGGSIIGSSIKGNGGTVYNGGTMNIASAEITGGSAANGGNIYNAGKLNISDTAKVFDGTAAKLGHNIFNTDSSSFTNTGKVYMTGNENVIGIYPAYQACICGSKTEEHLPGCDGTKVKWGEWTKTDSLPTTSGYYFLTGDVVLTGNNTINSDAVIGLDLNGKTVKLDTVTAENTNIRVYNMIENDTDVSVTILDSVGTGKIDLSDSTMLGTLALIYDAPDATADKPNGVKTFTLYSGVVDGSNVSIADNGNGGAVIRNVNQTVNIHGGTIIGGTAETVYDVEDPTTIKISSYGGAIWSGGTLNITGGAIHSGTGRNGGNVYINGGTFNMSGGAIYGGEATYQGGNVYVVTGSTVNMTGGNIYDGVTASNSGGNVYIKGSEFTMTGGEIYGGTAQNGGNVFVTEGGYFEMSGGKVYGGDATATNGRGGNIFSTVTGAVAISGSAQVYDGTAVAFGANIYCADGSIFTNSGNVYITGAAGDYRGIYPARIGCICGSSTDSHLNGCDGTLHFWKEWTDPAKLPTESGYYWLTCDVSVSEQQKIGAADVYLDLNGKTVTGGSSRIYNMTAADTTSSLTILDSVGTARIELGNTTDAGALVIMNLDTKTFTLYGGTVNGASLNGTGCGLVIRNVNQTVNIHGGTIIGGTTAGNGTGSGIGGAIYNGGVMNITGGSIYGGSAVNGGNIYNAGTLTVSGTAEIRDGVASNKGPNICNATGAVFQNTGSVYLTGNTAAFGIYPVRVGCICGSSTDSHLTGCSAAQQSWSEWLSSDSLPTASGYYMLTCDVNITAAQVIDSEVDVYLDLNGKTVTATSRVYEMSAANTACTLTVLDSVGTAKVTMSGTTNAAFANLDGTGGGKSLTIYGGEFDASGVNTEENAGMIRVVNNNSFRLHGGTLIGATASKAGGVVFMENGSITMTGGEIKNGTANNGGNIFMNPGSFTMTGGYIHSGKAVASNGRGGNIFNAGSSTVTISADARVLVGEGSSASTTAASDNIYSSAAGNLTVAVNSSANIDNAAGDIYPATRIGCICGSATTHLTGCDGKYVNKWQAWTSNNSLPTASGYYYLTADTVTLTANQVISNDAEIYLDLNGKTVVNGTNKRIYNMIANGKTCSLTILDSVGTGRIELGSTNQAGALVIMNNDTKTFTLYGGTVNGASVSGTGNGMIIRNVNQSVYIHGGTIIGGTTNGDPDSSGIGGAVYVGKTFVMTGGEIKNGTAARGGNIVVAANATAKIYGNAKVYNGTATATNYADSGNIYVLSGGSLSGENATDAVGTDNVYVLDGDQKLENATRIYFVN